MERPYKKYLVYGKELIKFATKIAEKKEGNNKNKSGLGYMPHIKIIMGDQKSRHRQT